MPSFPPRPYTPTPWGRRNGSSSNGCGGSAMGSAEASSQDGTLDVMDSVVIRDPAIMSGEPTFRGTRVLVRTLFDYLEAGHSLERFLTGFPSVSREMALHALEEA